MQSLPYDKLNLRNGAVSKKGFINIDLFTGDLTLDLRRGLPFENESLSLILSEHCFEHFDYPEPILFLLRECYRVLMPGGQLLSSVPDTEWPLKDYAKDEGDSYFTACERHAWHPEYCTTRMEHVNYHFRQNSEHRFAYDCETATKILKKAGFEVVNRREYDPAFDSEHRRIGSLFMLAKK